MGEEPLEALARRFRMFADECRGVSPLYERLSLEISRDPEMLILAADAGSGPVPNLFFAAVHFLLLGGVRHPLVDFYPSVLGKVRRDDPYPAFRSFCGERATEIRRLISTRRVQTNEVRRSALLLPAFAIVARRTGKPLALVEIGASAGLNLLFDRYSYDYGEGRRLNAPDVPVEIFCELRGERTPPIPKRFPKVFSRLGVDLAPVDVRDPEAVSWLEALIWPEEYSERAPLLRRTIEVAGQDPPLLLAGDALDLLPGILAATPNDATPCVFHTFTVNQFSEEARGRLTEILSEQASGRHLFRISSSTILERITQVWT